MDYLPRGEGNKKSFGSIEVTIKQIVKKADYTLTTLNIADNKVITRWWFCFVSNTIIYLVSLFWFDMMPCDMTIITWRAFSDVWSTCEAWRWDCDVWCSMCDVVCALCDVWCAMCDVWCVMRDERYAMWVVWCGWAMCYMDCAMWVVGCAICDVGWEICALYIYLFWLSCICSVRSY